MLARTCGGSIALANVFYGRMKLAVGVARQCGQAGRCEDAESTGRADGPDGDWCIALDVDGEGVECARGRVGGEGKKMWGVRWL